MRHAVARKEGLIIEIRIADNVLGNESRGPLHKHTIDELKAIWKELHATLKEKGLIKEN